MGCGPSQGQRIIERRLGGRPVLGCAWACRSCSKPVRAWSGQPGCAQWPGRVERLDAPVLPHGLEHRRAARRLRVVVRRGSPTGDSVSYIPTRPRRWRSPMGNPGLHPAVLTWTTYGERFISAVENGPLSATQFHPEKSGQAGCNCSGTGSPRWPGDARRSSSQSQGISRMRWEYPARPC